MMKTVVEHSLFHLGEVVVTAGTLRALPNADLLLSRTSFADQPFENRAVLSLAQAGMKAKLVANI
jgi:hypothetical protein